MWYNNIINKTKGGMYMLLRIILGSIVCVIVIIILFISAVCVTVWKVMVPTQYICVVFDEVFGMYLSEGVFSRNQPEHIIVGKIRIEFSNLEEACNEVEKYVDATLKGYDKHTWLNVAPEWKKSRDKLLEIRCRINWLRKKL